MAKLTYSSAHYLSFRSSSLEKIKMFSECSLNTSSAAWDLVKLISLLSIKQSHHTEGCSDSMLSRGLMPEEARRSLKLSGCCCWPHIFISQNTPMQKFKSLTEAQSLFSPYFKNTEKPHGLLWERPEWFPSYVHNTKSVACFSSFPLCTHSMYANAFSPRREKCDSVSIKVFQCLMT